MVVCFGERMVAHHPEQPESKRWWELVLEAPTANADETTNNLVRAGAERGIFRQCSIGWHMECSDWSGQNGCECRCHEIAEEAILEARRKRELL